MSNYSKRIQLDSGNYPDLLLRAALVGDGSYVVSKSYWTGDDTPCFYETFTGFDDLGGCLDYINDFTTVSAVNFFDRENR